MKRETWKQVDISGLAIGDVVRVGLKAYRGEAGRLHNGRVGVVKLIRYGDVIVRPMGDDRWYTEDVHHPPYKLEKKVIA